MEVGMALVLENCWLIFLGVHENLLDLPPGDIGNLHNVSIMSAGPDTADNKGPGQTVK